MKIADATIRMEAIVEFVINFSIFFLNFCDEHMIFCKETKAVWAYSIEISNYWNYLTNSTNKNLFILFIPLEFVIISKIVTEINE